MKTILIISFCMMSACGACQIQLSAGAGYGYFNMSDLKSFQERQVTGFPVEAEITSSFPPYWIYGLSGRVFMRDNLMMGISGAMGSTGSRAYYEDYSGSIGSDNLLRFTSLGLAFGGWGELGHRKLYFCVDLNPGVTFTSMTIRGFSSLGQYNNYENSTKLRSLNVTVQPSLAFTKRFGHYGITLFAGHHITIVPGKLKSKENKDAYLVHEGSPVKADWSGLRIGVNASLFFDRSSSPEAPYQ